MSDQLCISATFVDPLFHGRGDEAPEWPPAPMRLFQALLAGARSGSRGGEWSEAKAEAFRWLEGRQPPRIVAPSARPVSPWTLFVPDNVSDRVSDRQDRLVGKVARPHRLLNGDTVHYLWPIDESDGAAGRQHAGILCREARRLLALGWGIDQVVGNGRIVTDDEAAKLPGQRWHPWGGRTPGGQTWRVPTAGSLADLEQVHQAFQARLETKQYLHSSRCYSTISYLDREALPLRPYASFEFQEGAAFRQEDTAKLAAMLRSLACLRVRNDTHQFPGGSETYVAGHTGKQERTPARFSYLPLPTIGHQHADGMIRRALVAEPFGGDGTHARWAQQRLRTEVLRDATGWERNLLLDLWRPTSRSLVKRYVSPSRVWATVTPVLLPGFDDNRHSKAEHLLVAAMRQADLPVEALEELTIQRAPFWPGSQHARAYFTPAYLSHLPRWHVRLVFRALLPGPLAVGAGRHAGMGLLACDP